MLIGGALSLAIVASLDGMLCARLIESDSGNRIHANQELTRLGVGNMVAAGFGGIANGINLEAQPLVLGETLRMDVKAERFVRNDRANQMLTREYRKGFEVPAAPTA